MIQNRGTSNGHFRWGILGTGLIAGIQTKDLIANGFTVQAVGSRTPEASLAFSAKFNIPTAHDSYEALVADPEVDVIYVATPHTFHHAHALLALNAGKHVLVEKPFTVNAREAREVVDLAKATGLVALEAMWSRFLPHMIRLREILQEGTIGEVRKIIASHNQNASQDPSHRLNDHALGGGALLDLGIYPVSFAFDIFGPPEVIRASSSLTPAGVDRQTAAIFEYSKGQQAIIDCSLDSTGTNSATVIGTTGWIDIESTWYNATTFTVFATDKGVLERFYRPVKGRGMQFQAAELERLILAGGSAAATILPPDETVAVMLAMDSIRRQIGLRYEADTAPSNSG
ncbi:Gfo/Idh/MocA family protein [Arthrobacter rhizosphaerae]|uniref:Gfo/Idh/MocA family protein n=1 Tax=Arthrobacter rhizosphaerae TaxID=2855490 RepID=UPI001FF455E0|nr:Gfo/Idh/MocA family oxidoreductase [Arthrobacter rhizosphaerae]